VRECERQGVRKRENERENLLSVCYGHNMTESDGASERESNTARERESERARETGSEETRDNPSSVVCRHNTTENERVKARE